LFEYKKGENFNHRNILNISRIALKGRFAKVSMLDIRSTPYTQARVISYFSIHELGYRESDVAKALNLSRASVSKAVSRGEKLIDKNQRLLDLVKIS
jgi:hypothetical protein